MKLFTKPCAAALIDGLAPSARALVVLDVSPRESIANTKRIHAVIQAGVVVDRPAARAW